MKKNENESRIPQALQAVFLAAARGKEVHQAPPNRIAMKTFARGGRPRCWGRTNKQQLAAQQQQRIEEPAHTTRHHISPQTYLTSILKNRGYTTEVFCSLETAYYNHPTKLQQASYGLYLVNSVRENRLEQVCELLDAGISPNACNEHGESIVHLACRWDLVEMLELLVEEYGASVQIADDQGRTPLHELCMHHSDEPPLAMLDILMEQDALLWYVADRHGVVPLDYIPQSDDYDHWTGWTKYLMVRKDSLWPDRDIKKVGLQPASAWATQPPHSRPLVEPESSSTVATLGLEGIELMAQGCVAPGASLMMMKTNKLLNDDDDDDEKTLSKCDYSSTADETASLDGSHSLCSASSALLSSSDDDYDEDDSDSEFSIATFDEEEMADILGRLGTSKGGAVWSSM